MSFLKKSKKQPSNQDASSLHMVILFYFIGIAVKVMEVDSKPNDQELNCLYEFFPKMLNLRSKISLLYKDASEENLSLLALTKKIRNSSPNNYDLYKEICFKLIAIADADSPINHSEFEILTEAANDLGFLKEDLESWIEEYIIEPSGNDYDILNINKFSSMQELNDSYRALAMKYHPDKLFAHNDILDICITSYKKKYTLVSNAYQNLKSIRQKNEDI